MIDEKDRKILGLLGEHGDYTTRQIAKGTGLPVTTVHNRVARLRSEGIIRKFTIVPDYGKIGRGLLAYVLVSVDHEMLKEKSKTQNDLAREIRGISGVERADSVTGGVDIIVTVRAGDMEEMNGFLLENLQRLDGVGRTETLIVLHEN